MGLIKITEKYKIPTYDNPKHIQYGELNFDAGKCKECGVCISICPGGCIITDRFTKKDYINGTAKGKSGLPRLAISVNGKATLCMACLTCAAACPHEAISLKTPFRPGGRLRKLHQTAEMTYPKRY